MKYPSLANASDVSYPIPLELPVTNATFFHIVSPGYLCNSLILGTIMIKQKRLTTMLGLMELWQVIHLMWLKAIKNSQLH